MKKSEYQKPNCKAPKRAPSLGEQIVAVKEAADSVRRGQYVNGWWEKESERRYFEDLMAAWKTLRAIHSQSATAKREQHPCDSTNEPCQWELLHDKCATKLKALRQAKGEQ